MFLEKSAGSGTQSASAKKTGCEIMRQPTLYCFAGSAGWPRRYFSIRAHIAPKSGAPFRSPNASQASFAVTTSWRAKRPKPAMA